MQVASCSSKASLEMCVVLSFFLVHDLEERFKNIKLNFLLLKQSRCYIFRTSLAIA